MSLDVCLVPILFQSVIPRLPICVVLPCDDIFKLPVNHGGGGRMRGLASFRDSVLVAASGMSDMSMCGRSRFLIVNGFVCIELSTNRN